MQPTKREATQPNRRFRHTTKSGARHFKRTLVIKAQTRDEIQEVIR